MQWLIGFTKKNWFHTKVFLIFFPNFMEKYELYFGSFFSHLKNLHSILRFRLEKLNCGFSQSFHSLKNTTKLVTISGKTLQFFPEFSHFLHNFSPHCECSFNPLMLASNFDWHSSSYTFRNVRNGAIA